MSDTSLSVPKRRTVASLSAEVAAGQGQMTVLKESIASLQLALEDRGWSRIGNDYSADGLDLKTISTISETLRSHVVGGGLMKRISDMRGETVYGDGVGFKSFVRAKAAFESPNNALKLFSAEALAEINRAHATDGQVTFLIHKVTKEIIRVPLSEIDNPYVDSTDRERIWYVRRTYQEITPAKPRGETVSRYYVADTCPRSEAGRKSINEGAGIDIPVDQNYTAVPWHVNLQVGWPLGIPDLLASLQWAEKYTDYLKNQTKFAEALAMIAWQFKSASSDQAKKTGATVAMGGTAGSASTTTDIEMKQFPGGSAVSFENGKPLAAQAAAAAGVPVDGLLGESNEGKATTLDPHLKKMAALRRHSATAIFKRIGRLLGAPNLEVIWPDFETESPFRESQMIIAAWSTGMFQPDELRIPLAERLRIGLVEGSKAPKDILIPNTKSALEAAADAKPDPATGGGINGQGDDELGVGKTSDDTRTSNTARDNGEVGSE